MTDCRMIRPADAPPAKPVRSFAPAGNHKEAVIARNQIAEFLDATLLRPLYFSGAEQEARVERSMETMSLAERVMIEIDMRQRMAVAYSFDYDALR